MPDFLIGGWNPSLEMIEQSRDFVVEVFLDG